MIEVNWDDIQDEMDEEILLLSLEAKAEELYGHLSTDELEDLYWKTHRSYCKDCKCR